LARIAAVADRRENAMLIRATEDACFIMLRNGLTLEVVYDRVLTGRSAEDRVEWCESDEDQRPAPSSGVWLMGETVVFEVTAGQA
jgi:hypothetical protein